MTILYFDGFDNAALLRKPEAVYTGTIASGLGRDGSTNGALGANSGFNGTVSYVVTLPTAAATCIAGMAHMSLQLSAGTDSQNGLMIWSSGGTRRLHLILNASGFLELRLGAGNGTLLATSTGHSAITISAWYHVQAKVILHTSTGTAIIRLNNQTVINYSGQTSSVIASVDQWSYNNSTGVNVIHRTDDLWICDAVDATATQGRTNNDFLGDLKIFTVVPDGAGDSTSWTPSTGANYTTQDENPPNTTDYVSASAGSPGTRDLYTGTDLPATAADVFAMRPMAYVTKTDAGEGVLKHAVKQDGVTSTDSVGTYMPSGSYITSCGEVRTKNVATGVPLTVTDINNMQIGIEIG